MFTIGDDESEIVVLTVVTAVAFVVVVDVVVGIVVVVVYLEIPIKNQHYLKKKNEKKTL